MVIFATYADCDLKEQGKITRGDQVENGAQSLRESSGHFFFIYIFHYTLRFHPKRKCQNHPVPHNSIAQEIHGHTPVFNLQT